MSELTKTLTRCMQLNFRPISQHKFAGNKTSRGRGPKCTLKAIAKNAKIVWLDKKQWWGLRHDDLTLKMAVLSSQTIHAYFMLAFRTQASTRFVTGELKMRNRLSSIINHHPWYCIKVAVLKGLLTKQKNKKKWYSKQVDEGQLSKRMTKAQRSNGSSAL